MHLHILLCVLLSFRTIQSFQISSYLIWRFEAVTSVDIIVLGYWGRSLAHAFVDQGVQLVAHGASCRSELGVGLHYLTRYGFMGVIGLLSDILFVHQIVVSTYVGSTGRI